MKIAIQAADLDYARIDGTRVYILNMLKRFGSLSPEDDFYIYHRRDFNPELAPPNFANYKIKKISCPIFWTQLRLSYSMAKDKPDVLWMPMHNIPLLRSKRVKTTATIHDLAFKYFPGHFPKSVLPKINFLTGLAVRRSDKIIAISESTKNDILKFYPETDSRKIKVICHGFDKELFLEKISGNDSHKVLEKYSLEKNNYILYVGAIQPRKNLEVLLEAFEMLKKKECAGHSRFSPRKGCALKLVIAGEKAWKSEQFISKIKKSPYRGDIAVTGTIPFGEIKILYRFADVFVYPSLYEGFGIPVLEAFASGVPVICAQNSSLAEVGGKAALYFDAKNSGDLCLKIKEIIEDENLKKRFIERGKSQMERFSWEKCAKETLEYLKS